MIAIINGRDTALQTIYKSQYTSLAYETGSSGGPTAEKMALLFMGFDKLIYGTSHFFMKDSLLFQYATPGKIHRYVGVENDPVFARSTVEVCFDIYEGDDDCIPHEAAPHSSSGGSTSCGIGVRVNAREVCLTLEMGTGGSGTAPGSGGNDGGNNGGQTGGGGTDSGWNGDPCKTIGTSNPCNGGSGAGWMPVPPPSTGDPCNDAKPGADKATALSKEQKYLDAKAQIQGADPAVEHTVGFGRDAAKQLTTSAMANGSGNYGTIPDIPGGFADIHNHPGNTEPSAGDLYSLITKNTPTNGYNTRFVITGGAVYAFVIYDPAKADKFAIDHPKDQDINPQTGQPYPPEFPNNTNGNVFTDYDNARLYFNGTLNYPVLFADAMSMAFVLEKYNSGIAILKQDANGNFKILRAKQTSTQAPAGTCEDISCD